MRILITGAGGQLATDLVHLAPASGHVTSCIAYGIDELDITDSVAVQTAVRREADNARVGGGLAVINAAAWTDVDGAESNEELAFAVNATGPALLAAACVEVGAPLVHVSTDYVFDGARPGSGPPYTVEDKPDPQNAYGRTKLAGEQAVRALAPDLGYVVRTAWVYGPGKNFAATMARLANERDTVNVVDDQRGSPTWSRDLAAGLLGLLALRPTAGILHATNTGETTWYGYAREVFALLGHDPDRVHPTTSAEFITKASRPAYSVLDGSAWTDLGLPALPHWQTALARALTDPQTGVLRR